MSRKVQQEQHHLQCRPSNAAALRLDEKAASHLLHAKMIQPIKIAGHSQSESTLLLDLLVLGTESSIRMLTLLPLGWISLHSFRSTLPL